MARKTIDNVGVLKTPKAMMQAIDDNFTELYSVRSVNVKDFGAVGDGITDDRNSISIACSSLGDAGGTVHFPPGRYLIDTNIAIPNHITLQGTYQFVGNTDAVQYGTMSALIVNPAATITLGAGSGLYGHLIYRKGMTFPTVSEVGFAGTAITAGGDDCFLFNSTVLGFNKLFYSSDHQRCNIRNIQGDCRNGIEINECWDVARLSSIQLWPFSIYPSDGNYKRTGTAFKFSDGGDWNKLTDCFCWGYKDGFYIDGCNSITMLSCSADGPKEDPTSCGFTIMGVSQDTRLIACQSAGQYTGYKIETSSDIETRLIGCDSWGCNDHCVIIYGGDVSITGGNLRGDCNGVSLNSANSKVLIDQVNNSCTVPWNQSIEPLQLFKGNIRDNNWWRNSLITEGVWSPRISIGGSASGVTYQPWSEAYWNRVGNSVTLTGQVALSSKGSLTGVIQITNLPFQIDTSNAAYAAVAISVSDISFSGVIQANIKANSKIIELSQVQESGVKTYLTADNLTDITNINFNVTYRCVS